MTTPTWAPTPAALRSVMLGRDLDEQQDPMLQGVIDRIAGSLLAEAGETVPERWEPVAQAYVLYAAASQLELSLFPEQQIGNDAQAARYDRLAGAEIVRLRAGLDLSASTGAGDSSQRVGSIMLGF